MEEPQTDVVPQSIKWVSTVAAPATSGETPSIVKVASCARWNDQSNPVPQDQRGKVEAPISTNPASPDRRCLSIEQSQDKTGLWPQQIRFRNKISKKWCGVPGAIIFDKPTIVLTPITSSRLRPFPSGLDLIDRSDFQALCNLDDMIITAGPMMARAMIVARVNGSCSNSDIADTDGNVSKPIIVRIKTAQRSTTRSTIKVAEPTVRDTPMAAGKMNIRVKSPLRKGNKLFNAIEPMKGAMHCLTPTRAPHMLSKYHQRNTLRRFPITRAARPNTSHAGSVSQSIARVNEKSI